MNASRRAMVSSAVVWPLVVISHALSFAWFVSSASVRCGARSGLWGHKLGVCSFFTVGGVCCGKLSGRRR